MTTVPQGELFRARTHIRPNRANNVAHGTRKHGDVETNNTTARPNKEPLKPPSPLHPKSAPKTPFSTRKGDGGFNPTRAPASKGDKGFRQPSYLADRARPQCPRALKLCPAPPFHTWPLSPARGPDDLHLGPMTCTRATLPRRMLRGLRAYQGVNAHVQGLTCEQHATTGTVVPKTQTTSPTTPRFQRFSPRWSALWALHHLKP